MPAAPPPPPPPPRLTFAAFLRSGHGKVALATSVCALPVCALMLLNGQLLELARPRLLALREALLGREDGFHRDLLDARRGVYSAPRRAADGGGTGGGSGGSLFAGIGVRAAAAVPRQQQQQQEQQQQQQQ